MSRHFVLSFAVLIATAAAGEPFNFEKTPGRLPKDVVPRHYAIRIEPDLAAETFSGQVKIDVEASKDTAEIVLNSLDLQITKASLDGSPVKAEADNATQLLKLSGANVKPGKHAIELHFKGKLNERPQGLYLTRYQLPNGEGKKALVTQMEPADARRMFPCWDEPVFRATYQLTAVVPAGHTGLSNMPEEQTTIFPDGRREMVFGSSPAMSSYLVAFASAELEVIEDEVGGTKLRVLATPGKKAQMRYAMEATKKVLPYFNDYFGVAYPLPKLDQVAFPSVAAGGMENWGCIIYSETALLFDDANSSQSTRERVFSVVAHEIAHQWFGDLVTMAWWDNLWLNEGFASWMATKASDHFNPTWKKWLRAAESKEVAMRLDSRSTTHPIQQPVLSEADAMQAFDEITYQKGQAFLRMLESWLGEDAFRDGLRAYFKKHAYGNTTTEDLWTALENASGKQVRSMAAGWTEQPGFPLVGWDGKQVAQSRFTINQENPAPLTWMIPLVAQAWPNGTKQPLLLGKDPLPIASAGTSPTLLHPEGYYRLAYQGSTWESIEPLVKSLPEGNRLAIAQDTWALVQAGKAPLARWLAVAKQLQLDPSPTVGAHVVEVVSYLDQLARGSSERPEIQAWIRSFLAPRFAQIGWDPRPNEEPAMASHRAALIAVLGRCGDQAVLNESKRRAAEFLGKPESLAADLREPVLQLAGRDAAPELWETLHRLARSTTSTEQKHWLYGALIAAQDPALTKRALALSLTGELPAKLATRLVGRVASEGEKPEAAWEYAKSKLPELLALMSATSADEYVARLFKSFSDAARADELERFTKENLPPSAARPTAIAADEIRFQAKLKQRVLPELLTFLKKE